MILCKMMTDAGTSAEREAAARTLVTWPPDHYRLRLAEWGVWIDSHGQMALVKAVFDEIPPFVHQTGDPLSHFAEYFRYPSVVTKPIIHLTSDRTLAVDLEVHIHEGRPWFAYPLPNDFGLTQYPTSTGQKPLSGFSNWMPPPATQPTPDEFDPVPASPLANAHYGYPWLLPNHQIHDTTFQATASIYNLGLQWQSVIVSPACLTWMKLPAVPGNAKFRWWQSLRNVPSSWVSSRGESERFLYYDGPTRSHVPLSVSLSPSGKMLSFRSLPPEKLAYGVREQMFEDFKPVPGAATGRVPTHEGIFIALRSGVLRGKRVEIFPYGSVELESKLPLEGDQVVSEVRRMLTSYGLTAPEAEGLIAAWTPQFFRTEGRRFILRMSPEEYARQCPLEVRPAPTEVVRLGLILTEFDGAGQGTTTQPVK
jgi:hypothetical protein